MLACICPKCRQSLTLPADAAGKAFQCPRCAQQIRLAAVADSNGKDHVAGYEILEELGRGAMGVVYKARQPGLNRLVALKMILDGALASPEQRSRFRTEAETVARLNHPHIVHIHEIGEHDGRPFFSMEYIGGGNLAQYLNGTPLPPRHAARLAEQLAEGMHHAHQQGIVHRDLKPGNVLLQKPDVRTIKSESRTEEQQPGVTMERTGSLSQSSSVTESGTREWDLRPKIMDFGLAKQLDRSEGPTGTGAILGTASYMAPEQARGESKRIGPAADVWALGATLYEMLTGRPPFQSTNIAETLLQVALEEPVSPRQLQPAVPRDLETICLTCLAKAPERRYPSAQALAEDLHRFLEGLPVQARPVGHVERAVKWAKRRPALAGIVALVFLALLTLTGGAIWFAGAQYQQRLLSERLSQQAETDRAATVVSAAEAEELAKKEAEASKKEVQNRDRAVLASQTARLNLADHALDRGIELCTTQNDVSQGLLWIARSLTELAQIDAPKLRARAAQLERAARLNLAAWTDRQMARVERLLDHRGGVEAACFHPRRPVVATGGSDGTVRIWDIATGMEVAGPFAHTGRVRRLCWSRDGKLLAVGTGDSWNAHQNGARSTGEARVWDVDNRNPLTPPLVHKGTVWSVDLSPDGKQLLTGCHDRQARVWQVGRAQPLTVVKQDQPISGVGFLPDGSEFVTSTCANHWEGWQRAATLQVWQTATGKPRGPATKLGNVRSLVVLADGQVITGGNNAHLQFWDVFGGEGAGRPQHAGSIVTDLSASQDGTTVVAAGVDFRVRTFEADPDWRVGPQLYSAGPLHTVAISPDGLRFLTGDSYSARLWLLDRARRTDVKLKSTGAIKRVNLCGSGKRAILEYEPGSEFRVFDTANGQAVGPPIKLTQGATHFDMDWEGNTILFAIGGALRRYVSATGAELGQPLPTEITLMSARISPDGKLAVVGGHTTEKNAVRLFDLVAGKLIGAQPYINGRGNAVCFVPDGKSVMVGTWRSRVFQFSVPDMKLIGSQVNAHGAVTNVGTTRDGGTFLAGAHGPFHSVLGETKRGSELGLPLRHMSYASGFTPNGQITFTDDNETIRLWDVTSLKQIGPILRTPGKGSGWGCYSSIFTDDRTLLTVRNDGVARRWPAPEPLEGSPQRLGLWVQSLTGMSLDGHGGVSMLNAEEWQKVRQEMDALP